MRLLAALLLLAPATLAAQQADTVRTDGRARVAPLTPGVDTVDTYLVNPAGERRLVVVYVETITPAPDGGLLVVQRNTRPDGTVMSLDSIEVDARTLATRWHWDMTPRGRMRVAFANGRATGAAWDSTGAERPVDVPVAAGALDYSLGSLVVPRLPLREGYVAVLPSHDITRGPQSTTVRVVGRERVEHAGRTVEAWKVTLDYGSFVATQWVEAGARQAIRTEVARGQMRMVAERR